MEETFFSNIGRKIKTLAVTFAVLGCLASIIGAIVYWAKEFGDAGWGFLILICGPFAFWILSLFIYGFGELIEKTTEVAENTQQQTPPVKTQNIPTKNTEEIPQKTNDTPVVNGGKDYLTRYKTSPASTESKCPHCFQKIDKSKNPTVCPNCFLKL